MEKKRVKILYRVSTKKQLYGDDIPMQEKANRECVKQHPDWVVIDEIYERGVSAYKNHVEDRDAIMMLMEQAERHEYDVLLVYMSDRISRISEEYFIYMVRLSELGITIWSAMEGDRTIYDYQQKLIAYIHGYNAEGESLKTSIRTKTRLGQIVQDGCFRGGHAPYGYRLEKQGRVNPRKHEVNEILIDENEAPVVQMIFELSAVYGYESRKIARTLRDKGILNRKGQHFHPSTIQNMLKNVQYMGILRSGETKSEIFPHLQIVSPALFERVQEQIGSHRSDYEESRISLIRWEAPALLSGNVFCGTCGGRLIVTSTRKTHHKTKGVNPRIPIYRCYNRLQHSELCDGQSTYRADKVDAVVEDCVRNILQRVCLTGTQDYLDRCREQESARVKKQLKLLEKQYSTAEKQRHTLMGYMADVLDGKGPLTAEDLKEQLDALKERCAEITEQMNEQRKLLDASEKHMERVVTQINELKGYAEIYDNAGIEDKRRITSAIIERVEISRGYHINIKLRVGLDLLEELKENT